MVLIFHKSSDIVWGMMEEAGRSNFPDFFPVLRWIDPQGIRRRMKNYLDEAFDVFDEIICDSCWNSFASWWVLHLHLYFYSLLFSIQF